MFNEALKKNLAIFVILGDSFNVLKTAEMSAIKALQRADFKKLKISVIKIKKLRLYPYDIPLWYGGYPLIFRLVFFG